LDKAGELLRNGYNRAAGILAGVVLESHLSALCDAHSIEIKGKRTISNYNDSLKDKVYNLPTFRNIQRLADIRNICGHEKKNEPTTEEVEELIVGVDKIVKTVN